MKKPRIVSTRTSILLGVLVLLLVVTAALTGFEGEARVTLLLLCLSVPAIGFRIWRGLQLRRGGR